jgi:hypothetical protein
VELGVIWKALTRVCRTSRILHYSKFSSSRSPQDLWLDRHAAAHQHFPQRDDHRIDLLISIALLLVMRFLLSLHGDAVFGEYRFRESPRKRPDHINQSGLAASRSWQNSETNIAHIGRIRSIKEDIEKSRRARKDFLRQFKAYGRRSGRRIRRGK